MTAKVLLIISIILNTGLYGITDAEELKFTLEREKMVQEQILDRGIINKQILDAFRKVKRHLFVLPELRVKAYGDYPLSIGEDQTVSQPYIVAIMTHVVMGKGNNKKVLDIGTGSGYLAAILAEQAKQVYTIEYIDTLAEQAKKRLTDMGYKNISFKTGDGYKGWQEYAPYDGIIVSCAEDHIPPALIEQLAIGGRMIIPVSYSSEVQELVLIEKLQDGSMKKTNLIPVQFVPLIRGNDRTGEN